MRLRLRPIWVLVLIVLGTLIVLNRLSVQNLSSADTVSLTDRQDLRARLDSLEHRIQALESLEWR